MSSDTSPQGQEARAETRTRKIEGVDYKRAAREYPSKLNAQRRHYLLTKPFYNLRHRPDKYTQGFGLDPETHRYFCDFVNIAVTLDLEPGRRILDVGCGSGWLSEYFARLGYDVTGIDISDDLIEMARERLEGVPYQTDHEEPLRCRFLAHDIERAPLAETFAAVVCYDSLHHFEDEHAVFRHLSAMLDYGGLLFILEGEKPPDGSPTEQELTGVMEEFGTLESPFDREYLHALLRRNGLAVAGDYVSVDGLFHRDVLRQEGNLLRVEPPAVNYLLCKKVTRRVEPAAMPDSLEPGLLRARLTPIGEWPQRFAPGSTLRAALRVENTGDTLWLNGPATRRGAITLGIRLIDEEGRVVSETHGHPPLTRALAPGESLTLTLEHPLPARPGTYLFKIDLIDQHVCWFEDRGSEPLALSLTLTDE